MSLRTAYVKTIKELNELFNNSINVHSFALSDDKPYKNNLIAIYKEELLKDCYVIDFTAEEKTKYNFDIKKLSHDIYGTTDLFFLITILNDFRDYTDMDLIGSDIKIYIPNDIKKNFILDLVYKLKKDRKYENIHDGDMFE